ncbi:MAG TPA: phosphoribosylglycinamide synthetase C domain-containing protein, partial [Geobacteraceae bacterium]
ASQGYPGDYPKGVAISGLESAGKVEGVVVFHAGTKMCDGTVVTNGGRVLGVTGLGADVAAAIDSAYRAVARISWPGAQFRRDIGKRALNRAS